MLVRELPCKAAHRDQLVEHACHCFVPRNCRRCRGLCCEPSIGQKVWVEFSRAAGSHCIVEPADSNCVWLMQDGRVVDDVMVHKPILE